MSYAVEDVFSSERVITEKRGKLNVLPEAFSQKTPLVTAFFGCSFALFML
jgi:hypothetical protein